MILCYIISYYVIVHCIISYPCGVRAAARVPQSESSPLRRICGAETRPGSDSGSRAYPQLAS